MDYVMGWITTKPGRRDEFMRRAAPFVTGTRAERGVVFFELIPDPASADIVIAIEGYVSGDAHAAHLATPHFAEFWAVFEECVIEGRFENLTGVTARTDVVRPNAD
jgi:quinol monooxygenase YgiN